MVDPFKKPATSITEQIALLQQRGLTINDHASLEYHLTHVGYYRLAGYWQVLQNDPVKHTFIPGTAFENVVELYNFDRELRLIRNNLPEKKTIAQKLGLPTYTWLESWMVVISVLRNYCAHHCRICYRKFNFPPKELMRSKFPWIKNYPTGILKEHLYFQLCVVKYILDRCAPYNRFSSQLKQLITKYPSVSTGRMGFVPEWENEDLWQ